VQEGGGTAAIQRMADAVAHGKVTPDTVDQAFRRSRVLQPIIQFFWSRLMRARIQLGMFDPPEMVEWNYLMNDTTNVLSDLHVGIEISLPATAFSSLDDL
jgi:hypothetical protein